jgi:hypothetical protein
MKENVMNNKALVILLALACLVIGWLFGQVRTVTAEEKRSESEMQVYPFQRVTGPSSTGGAYIVKDGELWFLVGTSTTKVEFIDMADESILKMKEQYKNQ